MKISHKTCFHFLSAAKVKLITLCEAPYPSEPNRVQSRGHSQPYDCGWPAAP